MTMVVSETTDMNISARLVCVDDGIERLPWTRVLMRLFMSDMFDSGRGVAALKVMSEDTECVWA